MPGGLSTRRHCSRRLRNKSRRPRCKALPASKLGKATAYALGLWPRLTRFLEYPELELSNNLAENSMRPVAVGRRTGSISAVRRPGRESPRSFRSSRPVAGYRCPSGSIWPPFFPAWPISVFTNCRNSHPPPGRPATANYPDRGESNHPLQSARLTLLPGSALDRYRAFALTQARRDSRVSRNRNWARIMLTAIRPGLTIVNSAGFMAARRRPGPRSASEEHVLSPGESSYVVVRLCTNRGCRGSSCCPPDPQDGLARNEIHSECAERSTGPSIRPPKTLCRRTKGTRNNDRYCLPGIAGTTLVRRLDTPRM